ncbi:hypothetical protein [Frankia sp. QA3]|uniref:hypothetical protein n=1 Tax=Frankia sp. QA3 TaxID=710111 RepID=UPI000269CF3D|nr:hypothetical protein [Frankia sp. QA3]EIV96314.1 hypothetical protein FraQA3DRAFT_6197 [Frankia sp. QA3]
MHAELYSTVAQVIPVFLLALMWDSAYLDRLRAERRPARRAGTGGFFWTKPRVRVFILAVTAATMATLVVDVLVLAGVITDSAVVRGVVVAGLLLAMTTLLYRISVDVLRATVPDPPDDPPDDPPA